MILELTKKNVLKAMNNYKDCTNQALSNLATVYLNRVTELNWIDCLFKQNTNSHKNSINRIEIVERIQLFRFFIQI